MNINELKALLEKFHEGETTVEEELILKEFFRSDTVPPELIADKMQFLFYDQALREEFDDTGLEQILFSKNTREKPGLSLTLNHHRILYSVGMAAAFLLLLGLVFLFRLNLNEKKHEGEILAEREMVFHQAHDILALVSVNFNKGIDKMEYIGKLDEAMQKMELLSKYYQYQTIIYNPDQLEGSIKNK